MNPQKNGELYRKMGNLVYGVVAWCNDSHSCAKLVGGWAELDISSCHCPPTTFLGWIGEL